MNKHTWTKERIEKMLELEKEFLPSPYSIGYIEALKRVQSLMKIDEEVEDIYENTGT